MTLIMGLDIETTGLQQTEGHRMIEIAAIIYDLDTRTEKGRFETRLNPERAIDEKAQAVHKISIDDLFDKPLWEAVAPRFSLLMSKCQYVVAHNGQGFDMPFVFGEFIRVGATLPNTAVIDTLLQARWATPDGSVPNLGALCFACDVPYDKSKAHGATYDVEVMMQCFFSQFDRGFFSLPTEPYVYSVPKKEVK